MNIVKERLLVLGEDGPGLYTIEKIGGRMDGERFELWEVELEDGTRLNCWKSNARPGYFRSALVPVENQMEGIVFL